MRFLSSRLISVQLKCLTQGRSLFKSNISVTRDRCSTAIEPIVTKTNIKRPIKDGPNFKDFLIAGKNLPAQNDTNGTLVPYLDGNDLNGNGRKVLFEVYGCQMNVNDTEVVWSILKRNGFEKTSDIEQADVVLLMTCAIREKAETKVSLAVKHLLTLNWMNLC